jgi:hypothetical protein
MADSQSKPPQQPTLEMRVAALEDKLSQQKFTEAELQAYIKVASALAAQGTPVNPAVSGAMLPCAMPPGLGAMLPCAIPPGLGAMLPCAIPPGLGAMLPCGIPPVLGGGAPPTAQCHVYSCSGMLPCFGMLPCGAPPTKPPGEGGEGGDPTGTAGGFGSLGR